MQICYWTKKELIPSALWGGKLKRQNEIKNCVEKPETLSDQRYRNLLL